MRSLNNKLDYLNDILMNVKRNKNLRLLDVSLTCMKNKLYSKGGVTKRLINTQTVILDTATEQQSIRNIIHCKFSFVETSLPNVVPSPVQNSEHSKLITDLSNTQHKQ